MGPIAALPFLLAPSDRLPPVLTPPGAPPWNLAPADCVALLTHYLAYVAADGGPDLVDSPIAWSDAWAGRFVDPHALPRPAARRLARAALATLSDPRGERFLARADLAALYRVILAAAPLPQSRWGAAATTTVGLPALGPRGESWFVENPSGSGRWVSVAAVLPGVLPPAPRPVLDRVLAALVLRSARLPRGDSVRTTLIDRWVRRFARQVHRAARRVRRLRRRAAVRADDAPRSLPVRSAF